MWFLLRPEKVDELPPQYGAGNADFDKESADVIAGNQVSVQVEDHLASASIHIDKESVAGLGYTHVLGNLLGHSGQMVYNLVVFVHVVESGNVLPRDNEYVNRGRRPGIPKCHCQSIFVHFSSRQFPLNNFAKDAIAHRSTLEFSFGGKKQHPFG
jgi:hypothetical protein